MRGGGFRKGILARKAPWRRRYGWNTDAVKTCFTQGIENRLQEMGEQRTRWTGSLVIKEKDKPVHS